ncbi:hypothetical protein C8Q80DRAFT_1123498 [Daedaleopsis nitida]|nr:hypothetical protein C8Q80DRAFT_1123498 [Daedaleopsis nitida]
MPPYTTASHDRSQPSSSQNALADPTRNSVANTTSYTSLGHALAHGTSRPPDPHYHRQPSSSKSSRPSSQMASDSRYMYHPQGVPSAPPYPYPYPPSPAPYENGQYTQSSSRPPVRSPPPPPQPGQHAPPPAQYNGAPPSYPSQPGYPPPTYAVPSQPPQQWQGEWPHYNPSYPQPLPLASTRTLPQQQRTDALICHRRLPTRTGGMHNRRRRPGRTINPAGQRNGLRRAPRRPRPLPLQYVKPARSLQHRHLRPRSLCRSQLKPPRLRLRRPPQPRPPHPNPIPERDWDRFCKALTLNPGAQLVESYRLILDSATTLTYEANPARSSPAETIERMLQAAAYGAQVVDAVAKRAVPEQEPSHPAAIRPPEEGEGDGNRARQGDGGQPAVEGQTCLGCSATSTPEWRRGPMGPRTLCNACGLVYAKLIKKRNRTEPGRGRGGGQPAKQTGQIVHGLLEDHANMSSDGGGSDDDDSYGSQPDRGRSMYHDRRE